MSPAEEEIIDASVRRIKRRIYVLITFAWLHGLLTGYMIWSYWK